MAGLRAGTSFIDIETLHYAQNGRAVRRGCESDIKKESLPHSLTHSRSKITHPLLGETSVRKTTPNLTNLGCASDKTVMRAYGSVTFGQSGSVN